MKRTEINKPWSKAKGIVPAMAVMFYAGAVISSCSAAGGDSSIVSESTVETPEQIRMETSGNAATDSQSGAVNDTLAEAEHDIAGNTRQIAMFQELTRKSWYGDMDHDDYYDTSIWLHEDGTLSLKSDLDRLADLQKWSWTDNGTDKITLSGSHSSIQYSLSLNQDNFMLDDVVFLPYPMPQLSICEKPMYVAEPDDLIPDLSNDINIIHVSSGEDLRHEVLFHYPGELKDFKIYDLAYDFEAEGYGIKHTVFEMDRLTEGEAVLWKGYFGDIFTNLGFSFTDMEGNYHSLTVNWDMRGSTVNSSYIIVETKLHEPE